MFLGVPVPKEQHCKLIIKMLNFEKVSLIEKTLTLDKDMTLNELRKKNDKNQFDLVEVNIVEKTIRIYNNDEKIIKNHLIINDKIVLIEKSKKIVPFFVFFFEKINPNNCYLIIFNKKDVNSTTKLKEKCENFAKKSLNYEIHKSDITNISFKTNKIQNWNYTKDEPQIAYFCHTYKLKNGKNCLPF